MQSYSGNNSVIVIDNAWIHHDNELVELLERLEYCVIYFPLFL